MSRYIPPTHTTGCFRVSVTLCACLRFSCLYMQKVPEGLPSYALQTGSTGTDGRDVYGVIKCVSMMMVFGVGTHISKKRFFSGRTEPSSGRIVSTLGVRSSRISRAFFAFHFLRLVHPDAPLSLHSVRRACCGPTPSSFRPLVSAPLSSRLLASCLLLAVAHVRRPSLLPSHLWRPRSVLFHPLPSTAILRRFFLSLHRTVIAIIPLLFTRGPARPPCRRPTLVGFPSHRRA